MDYLPKLGDFILGGGGKGGITTGLISRVGIHRSIEVREPSPLLREPNEFVFGSSDTRDGGEDILGVGE